MNAYLADVKEHAADVNEAAVVAIVKYCGIALRKPNSSLVSTTSPVEAATIRDGFAAKKLGLDSATAAAGIKAVGEKLKDTRHKSRVTFYYLLAEATGTMSKLG